jgi:DNA invertase Pin-like site-specific DNA recombinase
MIGGIIMSKVYGYCRVALANEEEMAEQVRLVGDYCKDNGLTVDEYFCDNGISGLNSHRDAFNKMLYVLQDGDVVVVKDVARLSRDMKQCMSFVELMDQLGVTLKTIY